VGYKLDIVGTKEIGAGRIAGPGLLWYSNATGGLVNFGLHVLRT